MAKETDESVRLPRVPSVDDVYVMVGGGSGKHSAWCPTARSAARSAASSTASDRGARDGQEDEGGQEQRRARDADRAEASPNTSRPSAVAVSGSSSDTMPAAVAGTRPSPAVNIT